MPGGRRSRTTIIAIGSIIAIPAIFTALGASQDAGLAFGVTLVIVGVLWMLADARGKG